MRLRANNVSGNLNNAGLTNSATTINFAQVPNFPTITAPDYFALVLESGTANEEVVYLTAFANGSTTGTITRGQEGTSAVSHVGGASWLHGSTVQDFNTGASPNLATFSVFLSVSVGGAPYTSLPIAASYLTARAGDKLTITDNNGHTDVVTLTAALHIGDTTLSVASFTPSTTYNAGTELVPTSLSYTVPTDVYLLKAQLVAGGGAGGAGTVPTSAVNQAGSSGGGEGECITALLQVTPGTVLTLVVGIGGLIWPGNTGSLAAYNGDPTQILNGATVIASTRGGEQGQKSAVNATTGVVGGVYGGTGTASGSIGFGPAFAPGFGAQTLNNPAGAVPPGGSGGYGGGNATATLGGGGGSGGAVNRATGQPGSSGGSSNANGVSGGNGAPNTGAGGGGGGAASYNSGAPGTAGNGGAGGSGLIILEPFG